MQTAYQSPLEGNETPRADLLVKTNCNVCGANDFQVLYGAGVAQINQIVKCNQCGLMYASPRIEADVVRMEMWPDDPNIDLEQERLQRFEKEGLQVRDLATTRKQLNDLHPARGKLIEIGSSFGCGLEAFRKDHWDVLGIEPDRYAAKYTSERMKIQTLNSTLESAKLPAESADVVVILHVIEHVPDPVGTLREILRVLKPGGHLILETPRYDTAMFRLMGRRERSLSCDGHIFFFTTDTLRRAYTAAGFQLVRLDYTGRSLTLDRLAYNIGVMSKSRKVQQAVAWLSPRLWLNKVSVTINLRDMQRLCLVKP